MKYFALSLFLHALVVMTGLIFTFKSREASTPASRRQITVELISSSKKSGPSIGKKFRRKKAIAKKLKRLKSSSTAPSVRQPRLAKKQEKLKESDSDSNQVESKESVVLNYTQELKLHIEKAKHYPRQAIRLKQSGTVEIEVRIDSRGNFSDIHLSKASTFPLLDEAAVSLLKKLGRFKPLPKDIPPNSNFTIPIAYVTGRVQ